MKLRPPYLIILAMIAPLLMACGPSATPVPPTATTAPTATSNPPPAAEKAKQALAQQLGADPAQLQLVALDPVTWPDGSLGCPEPGKLYTQAIVSGFRAVFVHNGQQREVHTNQDGSLVVFCVSTTRPATSTY